MKMNTEERVSGSFRDPSGFMFEKDGELFRQVNLIYKDDYELLMNSGLYKELTDRGLLIRHEKVSFEKVKAGEAYKLIKPKKIKFISYPYEWCFSQLKNAALATLEIQETALKYGMSLKDASAYNIQFENVNPVFIDTLSFEKYEEGKPWVAYRQFCQHFLAPLALMAYTDIRLSQLLRVYIDGVPLDLAGKLLPAWSKLKFSLLMHIHLHAGSQKRYADKSVDTKAKKMNRLALNGLVDSLKSAVKKLKWNPGGTEWADYYDGTNYSNDAEKSKTEAVAKFLDEISPREVWDLGGNTGVYSRLASKRGIKTVSFDIDPASVEKSYVEAFNKKEQSIVPLVLDLTNPSPGMGWQNSERSSLIERGPVHAAMALALIHHLAISNNVPLEKVADFFSDLCEWLIIEFVPKSDSQVRRLLATREDIFPDYTFEGFEKVFESRFILKKTAKIANSERMIYLMKRR